MHKCPMCGTEFEGNFCPECGAKWEEEKKCPQCGKTLAGGVKFCPDCGYSFVPAPKAPPKPKPAEGRPVTEGTKKLYAFVSVFPTVLFVLLSVVFMFLFLAPVAVMPGGELLGQTIPSESYGNVFEVSNFDGSSMTGSLTTLIVFAVCALVLAAVIAVTALFSKARYKRVSVFGKTIFLRSLLTALGYVLFFVLFIISCVLFGQISDEDGGFGLIEAGAAPVLILVFALIGCLAALGCAFAGKYLRSTYPALVTAQEEKIAGAKPTGFETWLKNHKKAAAIVSAVLVVALIVGIAVPVAIANRHNGVYYVYNGETEEYNMERYYKLSGSTWQDNDGNKGEIVFDGENVKLTYDASGGMDKTGMSKIEMEGTIQKDVLKIGGTVYAKGGHKHEFSEWETIAEPTCVTTGSKIETCICGRRGNQETIPALGHSFVDHFCVNCGQNSSILLEYTLNKEETEYAVTGIGSCTDSEIIIPAEFNQKPVTSIGGSAFYGCSGLTSIEIPDSVTSIGSSAFYVTAYYNDESHWDSSGVLYIGNHLIEAKDTISGAYTIRTGTRMIADNAFSGCSGLTSVTIPDSVTSIGYSAFNNCSSLESISIPFVGNGSDETFLGYIFGDNAWYFFNSHVPISLKEVIITGGTSIGDWAFYNCSGLTSITIPDGVTSIGYGAFWGCSGLTSITIPDGVTSIEAEAFRECSGLTSITIPDNVTSIEGEAFGYCSGLTSITIPNSVTSIGDWAFNRCEGLTDIQFKGTVEEWQAIEKRSYWNSETGNYTITCTDGTIDIEGNVTYFE